MKKTIIFVIVLLMAALSLTATQAQSSNPVISNFQATVTAVSRDDLSAGTARIPVTWNVLNRPITSNLQFDQYMPGSGTYYNVELPRPWSWVNSSGDGMAAPVLPDNDEDVVRLRLRVIDWRNGAVQAESEWIVPINETGANPVLDVFSTSASSVNRSTLVNRSARVPVTWQVSDRPANANLVFDQVMPDGSLQNVELPRPDPIVPSTGNGIAAPYDPGAGVDSLRLRLRLVRLSDNTTLTSRDIVLPINDDSGSNEPRISIFDAVISTISANPLADRTAYLTVNWAVENRPANTNLVFEQVMPDGTLQNIELPRPDPYVSSSGAGVVRPYMPESRPDSIRLQVRLVNLVNNTTVKARHIDLAVIYDPGSVEILAFDVQPREANSGDTVTVSWDVRGVDAVSIRMAPQRAGDDVTTQAAAATPEVREQDRATGSMQMVVPEDVWRMIFWLDVSGGGAGPINVDVTQNCTHDWFADLDQRACPDGPATSTDAAYQRFERGFMLWQNDSIWVVYNSGGGAVFADTWDGSDISYGQEPPDGRYLPERGFGHLWTTNDTVRDGLGWAVAAEVGYTLQHQSYSADNNDYVTFTLPDARVAEIVLQGNTIFAIRY